MSSQSNTILNVDTIAELANFVNSKPVMYCLENKLLYVWNGNTPIVANSQQLANLQKITWTNKVGVSEGSGVNKGILTKTASSGWGNAGAFSNEGLITGYIQFGVSNNAGTRVIGLSKLDSDNDFTSVQYGILLGGAGSCYVASSGSLAAANPYALNDLFEIHINRLNNNNRAVYIFQNKSFIGGGGEITGEEAFFVDLALNELSTYIGAPFMLRYT